MTLVEIENHLEDDDDDDEIDDDDVDDNNNDDDVDECFEDNTLKRRILRLGKETSIYRPGGEV